MKNHFVLFAALCCIASVPVQAGKFIAMPEIGTGQLHTDSSYAFEDGYDGETNIYSIGFVGGYKFASNVILAANLSFSGTEVLTDRKDEYTLRETGLLIGYSIDVHRNVRIVPMLGWSSWDLFSEEGAVRGSEQKQKMDFSGTDAYGRLNFEFPVTDLFQITASYLYGNYEFGRYQTARVGFKFEF